MVTRQPTRDARPRRPEVDDEPIETRAASEPTTRGSAGNPFALVPGAPPSRVPEPGAGGSFTIDCRDCAHQSSPVCEDCVVSFIVDRSPGDAVVIDAGEARAVRLLERAGLVPASRHRRRVG
jgi:hypothetical protein